MYWFKNLIRLSSLVKHHSTDKFTPTLFSLQNIHQFATDTAAVGDAVAQPASGIVFLEFRSVAEPIDRIQPAISTETGSYFFLAICKGLDSKNHEMTMIRNLIRLSQRKLHTIVSREIIKPSSPTPSHLKTYNLSILDQIAANTFMPIVTFFPNNRSISRSSNDKIIDLKNSLSQTLTKYYPFAGRHAKVAPAYVDCNDNGAEFLEASIDSTLSDFLQNSQHQDLDQFFPHGLVNERSNRVDDLENDEVIPLAVQVNHFECGGVAVAVSMSHKIVDASSMTHFITDWAQMTRVFSEEQKHEVPEDPQFFPFPYKNINFSGISFQKSNDHITKSFMFPNSKISELKLKVKAMTAKSAQPITNPTRVEVLTWLLYKCGVAASTKNNSGSFKPTGVGHLINLRGKLMEKLPEKSIGNVVILVDILTQKESEMNPESFISEFRKQKLQLQGIRDIETTFHILSGISLKEIQRKFDDLYICSSLCGFPAYEIDFGWGKPIKVAIAGDLKKNSFIMMDAQNKDGIEVVVCLGKHEMAIVESDPELLAFL